MRKYTVIKPCNCIRSEKFASYFSNNFVRNCPICGKEVDHVEIVTQQHRDQIRPTICINNNKTIAVGNIYGDKFRIDKIFNGITLELQIEARNFICKKYDCDRIDITVIHEKEIPKPKPKQESLFTETEANKYLIIGNY